MKYLVLSLLLTTVTNSVFSQGSETSGWIFLSHTQKLSEKLGLLTDIQLRSSERFEYLHTLLLRGGLSYNLNKVHSGAVGYAYKGDWEKEDGIHVYEKENRIYEQYLAEFNAGKIEMSGRVRLEQRFIEKDHITDFSQRLRFFYSAKIPIAADTGFNRGLYANLQNELFLNIQHKDKVNGSLFDQNRALISLGYRLNKKMDIEIGYMLWHQKEETESIRNHVFQLMITTSF